MSNPTVSVIMPVYNGEQYVRFAVESVLGQTLQDFEFIVVDDGSADSTPSILAEYGSRLRYVRQDNTGAAGAFNHGLRLAAGRFVSWLSHDDVFLPAKLERQTAALGREAGAAVCYTDVRMIGPAGEVIEEHRMPEYGRGEALRHVMTGGPITLASYSICYDRRCVEEVGGYSEHWRYTQDAEMLMRLARRYPLIRVPEVLMQVREHGGRGMHSEQWRQEVSAFFRAQLDAVPLEEMFPELAGAASRAERAGKYLWLADAFAGHTQPLYGVAYSLYWKALRENPADAPRLLRRIAGLYWRRRGGARA